MVEVANLTRGGVLAGQCALGVTFYLRLRGLMFRPVFGPFDGLWLAPTREIHMFWVRFPIDLIWLDDGLRVVEVTRGIRPWRLKTCSRARSVLELPVGAAGDTQPGDRIAFHASGASA